MSHNEQIYLLRHESWWNILYYCGFFGIIFWKDVEEVKNRSRKKGVYCQLQQQKKQQQQPPHSKMHIFFSAGFNALLNSLDRCLEKGPSRSILFFRFFGIETIFRHIIISFWHLDFSTHATLKILFWKWNFIHLLKLAPFCIWGCRGCNVLE